MSAKPHARRTQDEGRVGARDGRDTTVAANEADQVFESAAELFGLLATPIRLKIISAVCHGERNVSELLASIPTTQPNMSQHLSTLYRSGVLAKRREGTQIYYRLQSERVASLCRAVCNQVAIEMEDPSEVPADQRLLTRELS